VINAEPSIYLTVPSTKIWIHRNRRWVWPVGIGLTLAVLVLIVWCALH
jgi:hypothetical protein